MKRPTLRFASALALFVGWAGCAPTVSPPGAYQPTHTGPVAFYEVDHQGRIAVSRVSTEPLVMVCVDPSLDAALAFTNRLVGDSNGKAVEGNGALYTKFGELATRTQIRLKFLREELARLCVAAAAAKLPSKKQMTVHGTTLGPQTGAHVSHHFEASISD